MLYMCDVCFTFIFIFVIIYHAISTKQIQLFVSLFLKYAILLLDDHLDEESEQFSNSYV